jgi:uncharacterized protein YeaO (DUF488 family)
MHMAETSIIQDSMVNEMIHLLRLYGDQSDRKGKVILVDRLWPRGISREDLWIDIWMKDIAPSNDLRKWFGHEAQKWDEFKDKYFTELDSNPLTAKLLDICRTSDVTFLYSAREEKINNAVALKLYVESHL